MEGKDGLWSLSPCSAHKKHHSAALGIVLITAGSVLLATLIASAVYWYYHNYHRPRADYQPVY